MKKKAFTLSCALLLAMLLSTAALASDKSIGGGAVKISGILSESTVQYVISADDYLGTPARTITAPLYKLDQSSKLVYDASIVPDSLCWINSSCKQEGDQLVYGESISTGYDDSPIRYVGEGEIPKVSSTGLDYTIDKVRTYSFYEDGYYLLQYDPEPMEFRDGNGGGIELSEKAEYIILQVSGAAGQPAGLTVEAKSASVAVDGTNQAMGAYMIADNNYFKLRDIALLLNGTAKQFEVEWDDAARAILLTTGKPYTAQAGDGGPLPAGQQTAVPNQSAIYLDGQPLALTAYNIGGNNYFKLRDVLQAIDCGVTWNPSTNTVQIQTDAGYTA